MGDGDEGPALGAGCAQGGASRGARRRLAKAARQQAKRFVGEVSEEGEACDADRLGRFEAKGVELAHSGAPVSGESFLAWLDEMKFLEKTFEMTAEGRAEAAAQVADAWEQGRGCAAAGLSGAAAERTPIAGGPKGASQDGLLDSPRTLAARGPWRSPRSPLLGCRQARGLGGECGRLGPRFAGC